MVPKLKMLRIYWNLAHLIFRKSQSRFWCQNLFLSNIYHLLGLNRFLAHSLFETCQSQFWCQNFGPKMKNAQNLLRFDQIDISNMPITILMSKWFLLNIHYLLGPNWSKIKSVQNLWNFDTFSNSITPISILPNIDQLLGPNLFQNQKYSIEI